MPYRSECVNRLGFRVALLAFTSVSAIAGAQPAGGDATPPEGSTDAAPVDAPGDVATTSAPAAPAPERPLPEADATVIEPTVPMQDVVGGRSKFSWEPFGFVRLQYIFVMNDPNVAFVGRDDGFELQNARIGVRGMYTERVRYAISVDGAVDERAQQNSPDGKLRVGLRDAFADVVLGPSKVFVRGGFFQTWADPQRLVADTLREFVDRPIESRGMRSTEGWYTPGLPPGRSIGMALRLEPVVANRLGFEIAAQNGADEFASNNDNDLPALSVAAQFRLADDGFLVAAARWNPRTVGELPFRQDETDVQGSFGAQVNTGPVQLGGAAIVQRTTFGSTGGPAENAYGAHAQIAFKIAAKSPVLIGYRFGILDPSSLIVTDRVMEHTVGTTIIVPSLRMRLQTQATHVMEQGERELSNTRVQLAAEVAL